MPLNEDITTYFKREIQAYYPDAWIDQKKTKVGYEIPMTRYFYEFPVFTSSDDLRAQLTAMETDIQRSLQILFGE